MFENHDLAQRFVRALRSGQYPQTQGALRNDSGFCALGVLCDLVDPEAWGRSEQTMFGYVGSSEITVTQYRPTWRHDGEVSYPSKYVTDKARLKHADGSKLMAANDAGVSFAQLADLIESAVARGNDDV